MPGPMVSRQVRLASAYIESLPPATQWGLEANRKGCELVIRASTIRAFHRIAKQLNMLSLKNQKKANQNLPELKKKICGLRITLTPPLPNKQHEWIERIEAGIDPEPEWSEP